MRTIASLLSQTELGRLTRAKQQLPASAPLLGPEMITFFKKSVEKRQGKLTKIAASWMQLVPELISDHCALDSLNRGTLTVVVDTASHLFELKQLLLAGIEQQLMIACKSAGLRKIALKRGRWYEAPAEGTERKIRFER